MNLIIIESPNKIKKLKSILSSDYEIIASVGHMFDLPKKDLGIDLDTFDVNLVLDENKKDILSDIKKYAEIAECIYIASDADREGEAVGFNIYTSLSKKNQKKCKRLLINSITKEAVEKAIKNPTVIDTNLSDAQKGRRATDRLAGYKISPIMWSKGLKGTSAGRVQSVALKYIADLEKEIIRSVYKKAGVAIENLPNGVFIEWRNGFYVAVNYAQTNFQIPLSTNHKIIVGSQPLQQGQALIWK
jgi:DNA topoisomerase-1